MWRQYCNTGSRITRTTEVEVKILHLIEKGNGLRQAPDGCLESCLWTLDGDEQTADYVALHKQKSQRSWKGGKLVGVREATDDELNNRSGNSVTKKGRLVVQFEPIREYNGRPGIPWGGKRKGTMAYKSLETIDDKSAGQLLS
jgi:hypothetical protein